MSWACPQVELWHLVAGASNCCRSWPWACLGPLEHLRRRLVGPLEHARATGMGQVQVTLDKVCPTAVYCHWHGTGVAWVRRGPRQRARAWVQAQAWP